MQALQKHFGNSLDVQPRSSSRLNMVSANKCKMIRKILKWRVHKTDEGWRSVAQSIRHHRKIVGFVSFSDSISYICSSLRRTWCYSDRKSIAENILALESLFSIPAPIMQAYLCHRLGPMHLFYHDRREPVLQLRTGPVRLCGGRACRLMYANGTHQGCASTARAHMPDQSNAAFDFRDKVLQSCERRLQIQ